jgi:hypothetical protein
MTRLTERWRRLPRRRRVGHELAQTLAVASQMALLCPSGMDVWMQRELTGCTDLDRFAGDHQRHNPRVHRPR